MTQITYLDTAIELEVHDLGSIGPDIKNTGQFYELEMLEYIRSTYPVQKTIIDAGSNIGNHILFYANFLEYKNIYGFEPNPDTFPLLERNITGLRAVVVQQKGLWSVPSSDGAIIHYNPEPGCTAVFPSEPYHAASAGIELVTIDSLGLRDVTLIKLDVEGPERQALIGGEITIRRDMPTLFVEISPMGNDQFPPQYTEIANLLATWGYAVRNQWYSHIMYEFIPIA